MKKDKEWLKKEVNNLEGVKFISNYLDFKSAMIDKAAVLELIDQLGELQEPDELHEVIKEAGQRLNNAIRSYMPESDKAEKHQDLYALKHFNSYLTKFEEELGSTSYTFEGGASLIDDEYSWVALNALTGNKDFIKELQNKIRQKTEIVKLSDLKPKYVVEVDDEFLAVTHYAPHHSNPALTYTDVKDHAIEFDTEEEAEAVVQLIGKGEVHAKN